MNNRELMEQLYEQNAGREGKSLLSIQGEPNVDTFVIAVNENRLLYASIIRGKQKQPYLRICEQTLGSFDHVVVDCESMKQLDTLLSKMLS